MRGRVKAYFTASRGWLEVVWNEAVKQVQWGGTDGDSNQT